MVGEGRSRVSGGGGCDVGGSAEGKVATNLVEDGEGWYRGSKGVGIVRATKEDDGRKVAVEEQKIEKTTVDKADGDRPGRETEEEK